MVVCTISLSANMCTQNNALKMFARDTTAVNAVYTELSL